MNVMEDKSQLYRPCVGIMLVNAKKKVFVGKRIDDVQEAWQMPQGGIDEGEDELIAAKRELFEETSILSIEIVSKINSWLYYDLPPYLKGKLWGGKYVGQKQRWFLAKFLGSESEINLSTKHPEFKSYRWENIDNLPKLIVDFKKDLYSKVISEFTPKLNLF
jgi:putative (di)nucleoside polyphosphate hydrolase